MHDLCFGESTAAVYCMKLTLTQCAAAGRTCEREERENKSLDGKTLQIEEAGVSFVGDSLFVELVLKANVLPPIRAFM